MPGRTFSFREILDAAAKPYRELWNENGDLNFARLAAHYAKRGAPLSQPSLWRLYNGKQAAQHKAVEATHKVFGVPRAMLRGEPISTEMDELLGNYKLSMLLLAKRIETLPKEDYQQVVELIALLESKREQLRQAIAVSENITPIDHGRRGPR